MATWTPDEQLAQNITRIVVRAREEGLRDAQAKEAAAMADFARRGVLNSGFALASAEDIAAESFDSWIRRAITDVLTYLQRVYGYVPQDAVPWIRDMFNEWIDAFPRNGPDRFVERRAAQGVPAHDIRPKFEAVAIAARRDLEIELGAIEVSARLGRIAAGELPSGTPGPRDVDVFICHASEDKLDVALPLFEALKKLDVSAWLDKYELTLGKSVFKTIEDGLRSCRFGVVILSPGFFAKRWPRRELAALAALGDADGADKILPVWHNVDHKAVAEGSPLLADLYAANTRDGIDSVAAAVTRVLRA
jgi:hypothetical protein